MCLCNHCVRTIVVLAPLAHGQPRGSQNPRVVPSPVVPTSRYEQLLVAANFDARRSRVLGAKRFDHLAESLRAKRKLAVVLHMHLWRWYSSFRRRQPKPHITFTTRNAPAVSKYRPCTSTPTLVHGVSKTNTIEFCRCAPVRATSYVWCLMSPREGVGCYMTI